MDAPPIFIFDLDGTLVDTAPDLLATLNRLLASEGRAGVASEELRRLVGRGARNLISEAFKLTGTPIDPARVEALYDDFLRDYGSHVADASRPYPGVVETLQALMDQGAVMGVLTNKPHGPTMALLEALDLTVFFAAVTGQGKEPYLKPDGRLFTGMVQTLGGGPALMVGDSITDVQTARNAGAPVILMSYGYTAEPASTLGADLVIDDFRDVPAAAARLLA